MIGQTISAEVGWPDSAIAQKVAYASASDVRPTLLSQPSLHPDMPCDQMAVVALSARTTGNVSAAYIKPL